MKSYLTV